MTKHIFLDNSYTRSCEARVTFSSNNIIELDNTVFYPRGGGQPGDSGSIQLENGTKIQVVDTIKGHNKGQVIHQINDCDTLPILGDSVIATIDWGRRYRHMRMHTCLHLLGAIIDAPITGGQLGESKGRLDFNLPNLGLGKEQIELQLNQLIKSSQPTTISWISDEDFANQPDLVKTMKVRPPADQGKVRLLKIGSIDLQPCGGTHVKCTNEIGTVRVAKIENKGKQNRRIHIKFAD